jgi:hypothetical protein
MLRYVSHAQTLVTIDASFRKTAPTKVTIDAVFRIIEGPDRAGAACVQPLRVNLGMITGRIQSIDSFQGKSRCFSTKQTFKPRKDLELRFGSRELRNDAR